MLKILAPWVSVYDFPCMQTIPIQVDRRGPFKCIIQCLNLANNLINNECHSESDAADDII